MKRILLFLACVLYLRSLPGESIAGDWQAGAARVKITPNQPMVMSGKQERDRPAEGTLDDLWAKALVLQDADGRRVALVTMDLVGIDRELSQAVCADLQRLYRLERAQVALAVSHTHNGPVVGGNLGNMFFLDSAQQSLVDSYAANLRKQLAVLVGEALERLSPCRLTWGIGNVDFAINRRNNPRSEIDERIARRDFKGPVDHDVSVLSVVDLSPWPRLPTVRN